MIISIGRFTKPTAEASVCPNLNYTFLLKSLKLNSFLDLSRTKAPCISKGGGKTQRTPPDQQESNQTEQNKSYLNEDIYSHYMGKVKGLLWLFRIYRVRRISSGYTTKRFTNGMAQLLGRRFLFFFFRKN